MANLVCHACGERVPFDEPVPRDADCPRCHADLRTCANCRYWDQRYHNQCTEPEADPVEDRRKRNFCEFFSYSSAPYAPADGGERAAAARAQLEALFAPRPRPRTTAPEAPDMPKQAPNVESSARARLEALFRSPPTDSGDDDE